MKKFLLLGLFVAFSASIFAQIAIQDFGAGNTWSYTPNPAAFNTGSDIWDIVSEEWYVQDLANSNGGTAVGDWGSLTFPNVDVSAYQSITLSFDYDVNGFDNGDDVKYEVFIDDASQGEVLLVDGNSNLSVNGTETINIPNGTGTVRIILSVKQNGGSDDAQFDNFQIQGSPLPITLASFNGDLDNNQVSLTWTTATETNNDYFNLERSKDGQRFEVIGKIAGAGNSTTTQKYEFIDHTPMRGTNYYRLSQTDYDGKSASFDVVSVDFKGAGTTTIRPTQVKDLMTLSLEPMESVGRVTIYNLVGQKVYSEVIEPGSTNLEIDASTFAQGQYVARVANGNFVETVRFIKL